MSVFDPKYNKRVLSNGSWSPMTDIPNALGYEDDYIKLYFGQFDVSITGPSSSPYTILKAGKLINVKVKKPVSYIKTNLYFVEDYDGIIEKDSKVITDFDTYTEHFIKPSKDIGTLSFNGSTYDDIYISTNNKASFVIYYKIDTVSNPNYGDTDYHNVVLQIGSTNLSDTICPMYCLTKDYAQSIGIGWDYGNNHMTVNEDTVIAAITNGTYSVSNNSYPLIPLSSSSTQYKLTGNFPSDSATSNYYKNYVYVITTNTVDASESFKFEYGYGQIDESKINITTYTAETISDISHRAPDGTLYNAIAVSIPIREYTLDLAKPTSGTDRTNIIGKDGTIKPIKPNGYLISKILGKVSVKDVTLDITANGTTTYESDGSFYNKIDINTNVQSIGDIKVGLSISEVNCNKDTLFYDESNIVFKLNVVVNDNYSVYLSIDNGKTFNEYTGDFVELYFVLGDTTKKIYYKLRNKNNNTYTSVSSIEIPVLGYILNAIEVPEIKVVKTGNDSVTIYVESLDSLDHHFNCNLNINNKDYTINDIDNNSINVKITSEYLTIESYFYKNISGAVYRGNSSKFIVNTNSLAVIELTKIEYNDPAYVYSKVPTKYYGVYLTLLKLLSDNGETLLNDCASACKSSSHKLTSLWNMFNAACGAYLNDNKKLADVLIKTITSQLNIMYDENFDFLQHRIFIGNYTLENKNNPNEFNTVDLYKLTPTEYDVCSDVELTFTIKQTSDIHYIMLPPELDLKYVSFGDTIKTVLFDSENNINLYKTRSWRMADKDTDGTIYWYYSPAGAFDDIITVVCKHK